MTLAQQASATLFDGLRGLIVACGHKVSKHDLAIVLITACIEHGLDTRRRIVGALGHLGFNHGHVAIILDEGTGRSPDGYHWQIDGEGRYAVHPTAKARSSLPTM